MFKVRLETDNAAFDTPSLEIARILRELANRIEHSIAQTGAIRDVNGNIVGQFEYRD